jgi:NADPH:quinone reductase-like Zn-dependent oxidoreductase
LIPGTDGAGIVVAKGSRVKRFSVGDPVYAYEFANPQGGFYAEFAVADANHVGRVPKSLRLREAGAAAATGLTALQGVAALHIRRGHSVLIFGASGGVGTMAVQFAAQQGARVLATASGGSAARLVRTLGATEVVDARKDEGLQRLRSAADEGLDGVLALAGGAGLERCLDLLRPGGRLIYPNGIEPAPRRRKTHRVHRFDVLADPEQFARLNRRFNQDRILVPIAATYSLAQADRAHRRLDRGKVLGRIALRIRV